MFVSRFTWSFLKYVRGSTDIHISGWSATSLGASQGHLTRNMSYLKPRIASLSPQWTKYEVREEIIHCDFNEYVSVISTMRTPHSPTGLVIKTRTCIMWAFGKSSRVLVTTQLEWTGKSFFKDIIERSALEDQRSHYKALEDAVRTNIYSDQPDFSTLALDRHPISVSGSVDSTVQNSDVSSSTTAVQLPPTDNSPSSSAQVVTDIRTLLATEADVASLLALDVSRIPPVLDLLQAEIRTTGLGQEHRRRCGKYLRLLVNKHRVLPPSLFVNKVEMSGAHPIDVGGYSDIYQGTFGDQSVCLKVLRIHIQEDDERINKDLREFYKEALLWTQLNHANLLPFLGVNTTLFPRRLCLVSPWMVNGQVTKYLETHPGHDRLRVLSEVSAGISYLHSHNIVHGDIKGANILVDEQGRCYLADFGLAGASMTTTLLSSTTNSVGKGTMRWMAPELFGDNSAGAAVGGSDVASTGPDKDSGSSKPNNVKLAVDIYAFACTIYELISGKLPFAHLSDPQVMLKVVFGARPERPTSVSWCPDNIWALVEQCWAHESRLRPTATDVYAFLSRLEQLRREEFPWEEERFLPVRMGTG
ncbi:kinase-like protein [Marasmius fiardii PR-910]|nr:kinase-like protein [Marasmius fiardii PR-910]